MTVRITLNGEVKQTEAADLAALIASLQLRSDRVAIEHNGAIVPRVQWPSTSLCEGDKLELVHFVGGGSCRIYC